MPAPSISAECMLLTALCIAIHSIIFEKECFPMEAPAWDMVSSKSLTLASASEHLGLTVQYLTKYRNLESASALSNHSYFGQGTWPELVA